MSDYIVIDLDGCISDHEWRWNQVDHSEPDKDKRYLDYNQQCGADKPMNIALIEQLLRPQNTYPLIVTARPIDVRIKTLAWLHDHFPVTIPNYNLLMRPAGITRPSPLLKLHLIELWLEQNGNINPKIVAALDDRQDVLDKYAEAGWNPILLAKQTPVNELSEPKTQLDRIEERVNSFTNHSKGYSEIEALTPLLFDEEDSHL